MLKTLFIMGIISCLSQADYQSWPKIDAHVHIETLDESFIKVAQEHNYKLISLVTNYHSTVEKQFEIVKELHQKYPATISFATSFTLEGLDKPDWQDKTIAWLKHCFDSGAIAVKIWKDVGMVCRDQDGSFIMIDDPRLDPVLDFIASENKTLVTHTGEPKNCWLPLDEMTVSGDRNYFKDHPQYHMYLHPEYPSHEELMAARDHMLAKHPDLRVVGAHLGSLEWDVDQVAQRLDKYPNFSVDLAERIVHFKVQNREKVRKFIIKYQDRLIYGSDIILDNGLLTCSSAEQLEKRARGTWRENWTYLSTDSVLSQSDAAGECRGLNLPVDVLKKVYYDNAVRVFHDSWLDRMVYNVKYTESNITVDGDTSKDIWRLSDKAQLLNYMGDKPEHFPCVSARLAYDDKGITVLFQVRDQYVKAVQDHYQGMVCNDSCVEFFFIPGTDPEGGYFNFEINCGGTVLFHFHKGDEDEPISEKDLNKVEVFHSMPKTIKTEITDPVEWAVEFKIPYDILKGYTNVVVPKPGEQWLMNLYKCADECSHPHWLTWSPVNYPTPKFHLPEYFGVLQFN